MTAKTHKPYRITPSSAWPGANQEPASILRNAAEGVAQNRQLLERNNWDSGNQPDSRSMTSGVADGPGQHASEG